MNKDAEAFLELISSDMRALAQLTKDWEDLILIILNCVEPESQHVHSKFIFVSLSDIVAGLLNKLLSLLQVLIFLRGEIGVVELDIDIRRADNQLFVLGLQVVGVFAWM